MTSLNLATPVTPATVPDAETPAKVEFSEIQQAKIQQILDGMTARHKAEVEALKAATPVVAPVASADFSKELDVTKAELSALKSQQRESAVAEQLRQAAGDLFLDTALATRLMRDAVNVGADGQPVVVNADGTPALNNEFQPLTLAQLAQRIATEKAFLARGAVRPGAGSIPAQSGPTTAPKLEDLFGKTSSGAAANRLALARPSEYRRLRQLAQERGLI